MDNAKKCRVCGEVKPLDEFPNRKAAKDGKRNDCRKCNYARNRHLHIAKSRATYAANREAIKEERRRFREAERERINVERRASRAKDPERYRAQQRKHYASNKEAIRERVKARNFRRRHVQIDKLIERDGPICGICLLELESIETAHVDHIVPRSCGGSNDLDNLQLAHQYCNQSRKDLPMEKYRLLVDSASPSSQGAKRCPSPTGQPAPAAPSRPAAAAGSPAI